MKESEIHWERLERRVLVDQPPFLQVYGDRVKLPNGAIIENYTVTKKPDSVIVVATTPTSELVAIRSYEYAVDQTLLHLPAGHLSPEEKPVDRAKAELLEETGFSGGKFSYLGKLYDYPSKDCHHHLVFRAKNVVPKAEQNLEPTEFIKVNLIPLSNLRDLISGGAFQVSSALAAISLAGII